MTNEVAAVAEGTAKTLSTTLRDQLQGGQTAWQRAVEWLTQEGLSFSLDLVVSILLLIIGAIAIRLIRAAVLRALNHGIRQNALLTKFVASVVSKVLWAFLIVTVLGRLGVDVGPLIAGLGVTGFILGFAFQESLGNLASGLMIAINQPFRVGDYVIVAGQEGAVQEVNMMATVLATGDNKRVVIPNKSAWGGPIVNFTALGTRRVDLKVGIGYGCDVARAIAVALEALSGVKGVLADPPPAVSVAGLDDSQVTLNVRPWTATGDYWTVYSGAYQAVKAAFDRAGIEIPFPQVDVHLEQCACS